MFNEHTKFTISHFNKKIKTCSLPSSVNLKLSNELGSNFACCHLKDCASWKIYENIIEILNFSIVLSLITTKSLSVYLIYF